MSVLLEQTSVSRTVQTRLDHTIVAVTLATLVTVMEETVQMLMSVLLEQITVSRTVQTLLDHTIVAVTLAILLTVIVETAQVQYYVCYPIVVSSLCYTSFRH